MLHYVILDKSRRPLRTAHTPEAAAKAVSEIGSANVSKVMSRESGESMREMTKEEAGRYIVEITRIASANVALLRRIKGRPR